MLKFLTYTKKLQIILILLSLLGLLLIMICTSKFGIGLDTDAILFIKVAKSLFSAGGFHQFDREMAIPPLYHIILAIFYQLGIDPAIGARYFHAILFGLIIFFAGSLFLKTLNSKTFAILGTITVFLSYPLFYVAHFSRTDTLFTLLFLLYTIYSFDYIQSSKLKTLIILSIISAIACLDRYPGIVLILSGIILIIFFSKEKTLKKKFEYSAIFALISSIPLIIWLFWIYHITNTIGGRGWLPFYSWNQYVYITFDVITKWFISPIHSFNLRFSLLSIIMLILVLSLLFIRIKFYLKANFPWKQLILLTVFILIYLTFLTFSQIAGATNGAETTNRTASPIYIHLILFILIGLEAFDFFMRSYWRNWIPTYIISVIYLIWLIFYPLGVLEKGITNCLKYGAGGVNSTDVRNSQLLKWIGENELEGTIYCNWPAALYFFYEIEAKRSPKRKTDLALYFQNEDKTTKKYLIWIKGGMPQMYYNFEEIYVQVALEEVATFSDGGVYIIK